jgi:hypothetical protein
MALSDVISLLAIVVVVASCGGFMVFATLVFVKPAIAERFLRSFASTARAHYIEQALRLLLGIALLAVSPLMWGSTVIRVLGWGIVLSTVGLMVVPWRWHNQLAQHLTPKLVGHMRVFAIAVFAFGAFLLVALCIGLKQHGWWFQESM